MIGKIRYAGYLFIIIQGVIIALLAVFLLNEQYMSEWQKYPQGSEYTVIYLKNVAPEKQKDIQHFLTETADQQKLFISRTDLMLDNNGSIKGYKIGVYGNVENNITDFSFLNCAILNSEKLSILLNAENPDSTLGVETGSVNSVGDIPHFRFYENVVVKQLGSLFNDSKTVNGQYKIVGLSESEEKKSFLHMLSEISGLSESNILETSGGNSSNNLVMRDILLAFFAAQIFLNIVFFLVIAMKNLPKQGKLVLLGWTRTAFAKEILGNFFVFSMLIIPVLVVVNGLLGGWGSFSVTLLSRYAVAACINVGLIGAEILISASVILITKPLDAIHGRIPRKVLYGLGIVAYLGVSFGVIFCGAYVDQPMKMISRNASLSQRWETVSQYQLLSEISIGEEAESFSGNSKELDQNLYDWYSSIAEKSGVYLIQTEYYNEDILKMWNSNQTYKAIPSDPFWLFTISPNYLETLGIQVDESALARAKEGARLYLMPAGMNEEEKEQVSKWVQEKDTKSISDGDIQTAFTQQPSFLFIEYESKEKLFTWTTDDKNSTEVNSPVIYIATPQNMKYTETESLKATGFNGYIKFADKQSAMACTAPSILSAYHLTDNSLIFTDVQNYIDGLQKELGTTLLWFGIIFLMLLLILLGLLLTLAMVFRIANQEKINVKKFLGFSFMQLYGKPMLMLIVWCVIELIAMLIIRSKFGLLLILAVSLIQVFIFIKFMARNELKNIITAFKGE